MNAITRSLSLALVVLLAALLPAACDRKQDVKGAMTDSEQAAQTETAPARAQATTPTGSPPAGTRTVTAVRVQKLVPQDFTLSATYIGYLLPQERVELRSEIEGAVERVLFDEGNRVMRGQLLTNIGTEQLQVRRNQAHADLSLAESNYLRDVNLHQKRLVTDAQLEQSRTRRDLARYGLELAEIELRKSQVTSPLGGVVKTRGINRGEFLNKGQLIAEILDISKVRARVDVPEREVRYLQIGRRVQVSFEALPGEKVTGSVRLVGLEADVKTRTFPVEVELNNSEARLRPGMLARVTVALEQYQNQLMIPRYAILERERGRVVFVAQDGKAVERNIETGASSEGQVQVLKGVSTGEQIVVVGQQKLTPGEPIDVRPSER